MADEAPIALKEVQLRLGVPQHVLIHGERALLKAITDDHLCEKGRDRVGFCRNLRSWKAPGVLAAEPIQFCVAPAVRMLQLLVASSDACQVAPQLQPEQSRSSSYPARSSSRAEFALHLYDGQQLVLGARLGSVRRPLFVAANIDQTSMMRRARQRAAPRRPKAGTLGRDGGRRGVEAGGGPDFPAMQAA